MRIVHDIECLPNFFSVAIVDYDSDREWLFEISERKNQINELIEFYKQVKYAIGFNSVHYDDIVLNFLFKNYNRLKSLEYNEITKQLKNMSDCVVNEQYDIYKQYKYQIIYTQIDLYCYWAKSARKTKMLSLKSISVGLNWRLIKEFPLKHTDNIKLEQIDEFLKYNFNDAYITKTLANKMSNDINLRIAAKKTYGLNCLSWDGVKLGQNVLLTKHCNKYNLDIKEVNTLRTYVDKVVLKDIINQNISFQERDYTELSYESKKVDGVTKTTIVCKNFYTLLNHIKTRTVTSTNELSYRVYYKDNIYDIASGGLHTYHNPEIVEPDLTKVFYEDIDASSYYPTLGAEWKFSPKHLGESFATTIGDIKNERLELKKKGLGKSNEAELLKLGLNGGYFGNLNNEYSPMYDWECLLKVTINGQLYLLMFAEMCEESGIKVDMCNTDGITVICPIEKRERLNEITKKFEELTKTETETAKYLKVVRMNINNYIAICEEKGKIKTKLKGMFDTSPILGKSNDELIIPKALEAYFKDGIEPEQFIRNHQNIFDFTLAYKIDKKYTVIWNNQVQQQLNRFYVSKKGYYLYKQKKDKTTLEHVLKGFAVQLYNEHVEKDIKDYDINYQYYIAETNKIINELQPKQLSLL